MNAGRNDDMVEKVAIDIDGRVCEAKLGEMIIAVADREGIAIPRFCYHPKLSVAANCRMCLVEVEQNGRPFPKPAPACATPVGANMKVWTRSPKALEAQRGTMEFLLINHPLDCPICDQGGECELQDVSMGYGSGVSRFSERKRVVADEDLGPLIASDMTRCIHCTRCVRFSAEITGVRELGATGRGEDMRIGTFVAHTVTHELSGNIIDLCPVGALTSKPYRFKARAWELTSHPGIAPHDALGAHLSLDVRQNRVLRVHPRANEAINEVWLADRDRFSYEGLTSPARLTQPLCKRDGSWQSCDWSEVLDIVTARLKNAGAALGCLIAPNVTLEEHYLAQKLVRGLGSGHIDSRLRQQDFRADAAGPVLPWLGMPIAALEQQQMVLVVGSDIRQEHPLLAHRLRKAAQRGASLLFINPYRLELHHPQHQIVVSPAEVPRVLAAMLKALGVTGEGVVKAWLTAAQPTEEQQNIATALRAAAGAAAVLIGGLAESDPNYSLIQALAAALAQATGARLGYLLRAANTLGAYIAGAVPHLAPGAVPLARPGLDAMAMVIDPRRAYLLWGIDPEFDLIDPSAARAAFDQADCVIAATAFRTRGLESVADVLLPLAAFGETAGTYVNLSGEWQSFTDAVAPPGEARPGWKILRVVGQQLGLSGFDYDTLAAIRAELAVLADSCIPDNRWRGVLNTTEHDVFEGSDLTRIGNVPIYALDMLVRHAPALQRTPWAEALAVHIHPLEAKRQGLAAGDRVRVTQGSAAVETTVVFDPGVALGCARVPAAVPGSADLGVAIGPMTLVKV